MTPSLHHKIDVWRARHGRHSWASRPTGLSVYAAFSGCYGFRVFGGFGWERVHSLAFATDLQAVRKRSGYWRSFWRNRNYSM